MSGTTDAQLAPPKEGLLRANFNVAELRAVELRAEGEGEGDAPSGPVMAGYFLVFDQWTEIKSYYEGNFLERFAAGSAKKTIRDNREAMRVLFQHGYDYAIGDKPLGPINELREEGEGVYYEVPLLDAAYVREEVLPGLEEDLYGASFRFRVIREEIDEEPGVSDHNPQGLPERTIKEVQILEFGPVTFPAYEGASAGVRSMRPRDLIDGLARDPERHLPEDTTSREEPAASEETPAEEPVETEVDETEEKSAPPTDSAEASPHPGNGRRAQPTSLYGVTPKKRSSRSWRL
jgi:HK97 family phage prohead protease